MSRFFQSLILLLTFMAFSIADDQKEWKPGPGWVKHSAVSMLSGKQEWYKKDSIGTAVRTLVKFVPYEFQYEYTLESQKKIIIEETDPANNLRVKLERDKKSFYGFVYTEAAHKDKSALLKSVILGNSRVQYFDLNGDGVIDCWIVRSDNVKAFIIYNDTIVPVGYQLSLFIGAVSNKSVVFTLDGKKRYEFLKDKWVLFEE